jgi:hypothetical protein
MGQLIVITTPEREPGYRLAGVTTRALENAGEAEKAIGDLHDAGCADLNALHET